MCQYRYIGFEDFRFAINAPVTFGRQSPQSKITFGFLGHEFSQSASKKLIRTACRLVENKDGIADTRRRQIKPCTKEKN
jgi:hypothetical protein